MTDAKLTPTMRTVLATIANGETVVPTGARKTAIVKLRDARLIRREWIDDNTPRNVITAKGREALVEKLTPTRERVLAKIRTPGVTRKSPMHLHGSEFSAAMWLFERGIIGLTGRGFFPL